METLSTYVYQFAVRGIFEDAALAALLIVAIGIAPAIRTVRVLNPGSPPAETENWPHKFFEAVR